MANPTIHSPTWAPPAPKPLTAPGPHSWEVNCPYLLPSAPTAEHFPARDSRGWYPGWASSPATATSSPEGRAGSTWWQPSRAGWRPQPPRAAAGCPPRFPARPACLPCSSCSKLCSRLARSGSCVRPSWRCSQPLCSEQTAWIQALRAGGGADRQGPEAQLGEKEINDDVISNRTERLPASSSRQQSSQREQRRFHVLSWRVTGAFRGPTQFLRRKRTNGCQEKNLCPDLGRTNVFNSAFLRMFSDAQGTQFCWAEPLQYSAAQCLKAVKCLRWGSIFHG